MKISTQEINKQKEKTFHPFNIVLTIEDESDLEDLAVRFNVGYTILNRDFNYNEFKAKENYSHWKEIDILLEEKPYMK